jgi:hypothetical protein
MGMSVVTVAAGGMPVVDVSATTKIGLPVSEAANKFGRAVTKVTAAGLPVVFVTPPLRRGTNDAASGGSARALPHRAKE